MPAPDADPLDPASARSNRLARGMGRAGGHREGRGREMDPYWKEADGLARPEGSVNADPPRRCGMDDAAVEAGGSDRQVQWEDAHASPGGCEADRGGTV